MNTKLVDDIASAVLYEGYLLYPYRASAIKNKQRWNFGVLYPREYAEKQSGADAWKMQTECLAIADSAQRSRCACDSCTWTAAGSSGTRSSICRRVGAVQNSWLTQRV